MNSRAVTLDPELNATAEPDAVPAPAGDYFYPDVTDYLGVSDSLEAIPTLGVPEKTIFKIVTENGMSEWQLTVGDDATDVDEGLVRPLDYNAITNPVVFMRIAGV